MIVDTHCHLNFILFREDLPEVLQNAKAAGINRMVVPAIDIETSREIVALTQIFPEIFAAVGIHPNEADNFTPDNINTLRVLAGEKMVVAIGEIGLDNYHQWQPCDVTCGYHCFCVVFGFRFKPQFIIYRSSLCIN